MPSRTEALTKAAEKVPFLDSSRAGLTKDFAFTLSIGTLREQLKVEDEAQAVIDSGDIGVRERSQAFNEIPTEHFLHVVDVSDRSFGKVGRTPMQTNVPREPV